jgi:hypothetical protein
MRDTAANAAPALPEGERAGAIVVSKANAAADRQAAKELTGEYVDLAEITDDEQNQIRMSPTTRPDRKATAKLLAAKGLSTREIAEHTG